jgi:hypothetical protein
MNSNAGRGFLKAILIVGFVFAIAYFISYNRWLSQDFNKVDITYNANRFEDDLNNQNTSNDSNQSNKKEYNDLYQRINYEFLEYNFGEEFYDMYYGNKPFNDDYYIYIGIANLIKSDAVVNCNLETKISKEELNKEIKSIIGNVKYIDKSFTTKNGLLKIEYDSDNSTYNVKLNGKCSGYDFTSGGIKNIFQKAIEANNKLYIYEKSLYIENIKDSKGNISFNYHEGIDKDSKIISNSFSDINTELLPTYIYEFEKINDVYTLQRITK